MVDGDDTQDGAAARKVERHDRATRAKARLAERRSDLATTNRHDPTRPSALKSVHEARNDLNRRWRTRAGITVTSAFLVAATVVHYAVVKSHHGPDAWSAARGAVPWAAWCTAGAILIAGLFATKRGMCVAYIIGKDNRVSTSKAQFALWTVALVFTFLFFTFEIARTKDDTTLLASFHRFGPEYLLLLGGPFAAAVGAAGITSSQVQSGATQKVAAAAPSVKDVATNDDGSPSLSDAQFFVFNLVALAFFAAALVKKPDQLPSMPTTLVALTSLSALTFLGAKVVTGSPPALVSAFIMTTPSNGNLHYGDQLTVTGSGILAPSTDGSTAPEDLQHVAVLIDTVAVYPDDPATVTDTQATVTVPAGLATTDKRNVALQLVTAAGVTTGSLTGFTVEPMLVLGATWSGAAAVVHGFGFGPADSDATVTVADNTGPVSGALTSKTPTALTFQPNTIPARGASLTLTVTCAGSTATVDVAVE